MINDLHLFTLTEAAGCKHEDCLTAEADNAGESRVFEGGAGGSGNSATGRSHLVYITISIIYIIILWAILLSEKSMISPRPSVSKATKEKHGVLFTKAIWICKAKIGRETMNL